MALYKEIELENGIILNYHRIVSLNKITNQRNIIEIASYVNEKQREKEMEYQEVQGKSADNQELTAEKQEILNKGINVLIDTNFVDKSYDESETIEKAYEYLKTTDKFKDAENI
jgi:hypothetical protein